MERLIGFTRLRHQDCQSGIRIINLKKKRVEQTVENHQSQSTIILPIMDMLKILFFSTLSVGFMYLSCQE